MMLRAELPVQRNRTWWTSRATATHRLVARPIGAEDGDRLERVERLPGETLRIDEPVLVREGVAALRARLGASRDAGPPHPGVHLGQLLVRLDLDPEMIEAGRRAPSRD